MNIPKHRIFQFSNLNELRVLNSKFSNNANIFLFKLNNVPTVDIFNAYMNTVVMFENTIVLNNNYYGVDTNSLFSTLFNINNQVTLVEMIFNKCIFQSNGMSIISQTSSLININLTNSLFQSNEAQEGVIYSTQSTQGTFNNLVLINNTFLNNTSFSTGGLFLFISTQQTVSAINNTYQGNLAVYSGGVGYIDSSRIVYSEVGGVYQGNFCFLSKSFISYI